MGSVKKEQLGVTLIATKHKLDNLTVIIVDYNKIQALSKLIRCITFEQSC